MNLYKDFFFNKTYWKMNNSSRISYRYFFPRIGNLYGSQFNAIYSIQKLDLIISVNVFSFFSRFSWHYNSTIIIFLYLNFSTRQKKIQRILTSNILRMS